VVALPRAVLHATGDPLRAARSWRVGQTFRVADDEVWWPAESGADRDDVAVVTVSYNTRELTAFLLWSLHRIVNRPDLEIVVVDNGSRDGSAPARSSA
jgi:hypothetical protein